MNQSERPEPYGDDPFKTNDEVDGYDEENPDGGIDDLEDVQDLYVFLYLSILPNRKATKKLLREIREKGKNTTYPEDLC